MGQAAWAVKTIVHVKKSVAALFPVVEMSVNKLGDPLTPPNSFTNMLNPTNYWTKISLASVNIEELVMLSLMC